VNYGKQVRVRTAMGSVKAAKLLWACDSFLNNMAQAHSSLAALTLPIAVRTRTCLP
jgi:hypothetical protein